MPVRISEYERRTLVQQALDFYISYLLRNEFPLLTRDSYSEDAWFQMLIHDGFRHSLTGTLMNKYSVQSNAVLLGVQQLTLNLLSPPKTLGAFAQWTSATQPACTQHTYFALPLVARGLTTIGGTQGIR